MKKIFILFLPVILFIGFGCASMMPERLIADRATSMSKSESSQGSSANRMVIYNAYITLEVPEVTDQIIEEIKKLARQYEGYVLASGTGYANIRVKADKLNEAIAALALMGEITEKQISGQDVTEQYQNTEITLESSYKARERYLTLLSEAENVETALKVEVELERINGQIELLEGQLNRMKHLTQFSTLHVTVKKKVLPGPLGWIFYGLYKAVTWLFIWE